MLLNDKNCLITGGSRGLGAHLADALWEEGANLLLVSKNEDALRDVVDKLARKDGQVALSMAADLAHPESAQQICDFARAHFSRIDLLINNAAIQGPVGQLWEISWDQWVATLSVDLLAPAALCRLVAPWMIERGGGRIVNVSGGGAAGPRANFSAYATAKAGLVRFSETLAEELRPHGVWVNCIAPGAMNTSMVDEVLLSGEEAAGAREFAQAQKVQRDGGASMRRVADLCVFLASDAANGITGKLISAVWDPWPHLPRHLEELVGTDIYTLRRVVPGDRGKTWGNDQ